MHKFYKSFLITVSRLPLGVLYGLSDIFSFFQKFVFGYRKEVVMQNLKNSFPEKSEKELKQIYHAFFKNFYDFIIESLKGITITQKQIDTRIEFEGIEILEKYLAQEKNIMALCGHLFNWEWLKGLVVHVPQNDIKAVYSVPSSKLVQEIISKSREKFGGEIIPMHEAKQLINSVPQNGNSIFLMVADQSPYKMAIRYDLQFLNQTTPVFQGFDKIARRNNLAVVYIDIIRKGRGQFLYKIIDIQPDNEKFFENEIIHKFFNLLEKSIHKQPSNYMWTHRRWKYKKGIDY
ncbi:MAG: lysophospholipid acyltransferase family protein [Flavobacteriaceae bacterium]|nr:lysophospholipid acyltransferase family protein [Flavobacteriaceae bacterium]